MAARTNNDININELKKKGKLTVTELDKLGEHYFWSETNNRARTIAMINDGIKENRIVALGLNINKRNMALTGDPGEQISKIIREPEMQKMIRSMQQQLKRARNMER